MKKILFALLMTIVAVGANAQGQRREINPEQQATRQATHMKETCNLTDEQYTKIYNVYLESANKTKAQMDSLMAAVQNGGERPKFDRESMEKRQKEMQEKIKSILTEEQYAKYEAAQKERRQRMGNRPGGPMGGPMGGPQNQ